ncbi:MAG: hypothetical protein HKN14_10730 [Marinicaulis sp.]|nr:hypothetical protein [Marinicaulis sp.]NNE41376.1 hypothetical protein [Marinicaulis sp.]NNL89456.1 hypothetical protein [Marinicaulis sp.]
MADDRKQSPHYIPELDPENQKRWNGSISQGVIWFLFVVGSLFALVGGSVMAFTDYEWAIYLLIAGVVMLALLWPAGIF